MDRGSGTLSKQMADFVIVCIIRQYTRASAKKSEKGEVTCGLSLALSASHQSTFIICPHLLLFSIHLLKNTFPYVTEQDNLSAFFHLIRVSSTPTRTSSSYLTKFGGILGNF